MNKASPIIFLFILTNHEKLIMLKKQEKKNCRILKIVVKSVEKRAISVVCIVI